MKIVKVASGTVLVVLGVVDAVMNANTPWWLHGALLPGTPAPQGICAAVDIADHGYPFDTNHYGSCGLSFSAIAQGLDWVILAAILAGGLGLCWYGLRTVSKKKRSRKAA